MMRAPRRDLILNFLLHKKERPGDFTRPNLHKTPTRLRPFGPPTGAGFWANFAQIASILNSVQIHGISGAPGTYKTNLVLYVRKKVQRRATVPLRSACGRRPTPIEWLVAYVMVPK
jgi:hypothetical protein